MKVILSHSSFIFLPRIRVRASSYFRKAVGWPPVSGAAIEKSTSNPHTKADPLLFPQLCFATRECSGRTREYRLRGPTSPGTSSYRPLSWRLTSAGHVVYPGRSLFIWSYRSGTLTPIQNEEISDKDGRMSRQEKKIIIHHVIKHSSYDASSSSTLWQFHNATFLLARKHIVYL